MSILAIETTGETASAALLDEEENLFQKTNSGRMDHLHSLIPMIGELVEEAGLEMSDIEMIAVSSGPGSFTGIRIGVSAARTLAQVLNIPVAAVMTLDSFAFNDFGIEEAESDSTLIVPMIDARRNQVYAAAYTCGNVEQVVPAGAADAAEFLSEVKRAAENGFKKIIFCGDGSKAYASLIDAIDFEGSEICCSDGSAAVQNAAAVLKAGLLMKSKGGLCAFNEAMPVYFRKAEAEQKREAGKLGLKKRIVKDEGPILEIPPADGIIEYRMIGPEEVQALAELDAVCFSKSWGREAFESEFGGTKTAVYSGAYNSRGELIGFAGLVYMFDEGDVNRVAVHPLYRVKGIGGNCLGAVLDEAARAGVRKVLLEVREANRSAISLYKEYGFRVISKRKGYYSETGENALIMQKEQR